MHWRVLPLLFWRDAARAILERTTLTSRLFIYLKLVSTVGVPANLDFLDQEEDDAEPYQAIDPDNPLEAEIAAYHRREKPHASADVVYVRIAD
jgi:hypothetical protein